MENGNALRILQVNAWDIGGGAASVAWNLFHAYRTRGHRSWLAVGRKYSNEPDVLQIPQNHELYNAWSLFWGRIRRRLLQVEQPQSITVPLSEVAFALAEPKRAMDIVWGIEDFNFPGSAQLQALPQEQPTVVHAHNLHDNYFDLRLLPALSHQRPLLLTLHDAWLLSGHCAHSFDCSRWRNGCGNCPDLTIPPEIRRDATRYNWQRKRRIYDQCKLYVATPSSWLMTKVEQSILAPAVVDARIIPNGVDLEVFQPARQREAREALELPQDAGVLLFAANTILHNAWKDYESVRAAVALLGQRLPERDIVLVALGEGGPAERIGGAEIRFVPYQRLPETVARFYQAADVYVHATHADSFPTSILEALACGTPVVATAVGGIPEQIEEGSSGFLVEPGKAEQLARRIALLLKDEGRRREMGATAAKVARNRFDFRCQVDAYLDWYTELALSDEHSAGEP